MSVKPATTAQILDDFDDATDWTVGNSGTHTNDAVTEWEGQGLALSNKGLRFHADISSGVHDGSFTKPIGAGWDVAAGKAVHLRVYTEDGWCLKTAPGVPFYGFRLRFVLADGSYLETKNNELYPEGISGGDAQAQLYGGRDLVLVLPDLTDFPDSDAPSSSSDFQWNRSGAAANANSWYDSWKAAGGTLRILVSNNTGQSADIMLEQFRIIDYTPVVSLTFDDGYTGWHDLARSIMASNSIKGTLFVGGNRVNTGSGNNMDTTQLADMIADGHDIQNHGWSETNASTYGGTVEEYVDDIIQNERWLADQGADLTPPRIFAYPAGKFNDGTFSDRSIEIAVLEAGFYAATTSFSNNEGENYVSGELLAPFRGRMQRPAFLVSTYTTLQAFLDDMYWFCVLSKRDWNINLHDVLAGTTLSGAEASGQTVISVTDASDMSVNDHFQVRLDDGTIHNSYITAISSNDVTINDALPSAAASGNEAGYSTSDDIGYLAFETLCAQLATWRSSGLIQTATMKEAIAAYDSSNISQAASTQPRRARLLYPGRLS